jgi:hypothetical protein
MNRPKKNSHCHHDQPAECWQVGSLRQGSDSAFADPARGELYRSVASSLDDKGETDFASFRANPVAWAMRYGAALVSRSDLEAPIIFFGWRDGDVTIAVPPGDLCEDCCHAVITDMIQGMDGGAASYLVLEKGAMREKGDDSWSDAFRVVYGFAGSTTAAAFGREYGVGLTGTVELAEKSYLIEKYPSLWQSSDGFADIGEPVEDDLSFEALKSGCQELADLRPELDACDFQDKALEKQFYALREEVVPLVAGLVGVLGEAGLVTMRVWDDDFERFVEFEAVSARENGGLLIDCNMDVVGNSCPPPDITSIVNDLEAQRRGPRQGVARLVAVPERRADGHRAAPAPKSSAQQ